MFTVELITTSVNLDTEFKTRVTVCTGFPSLIKRVQWKISEPTGSFQQLAVDMDKATGTAQHTGNVLLKKGANLVEIRFESDAQEFTPWQTVETVTNQTEQVYPNENMCQDDGN